MQLNDEQKRAVAMCVSEETRACVITGGPGTGKTTVIKTICERFKDEKIVLCAPTGVAAQVLEKAARSSKATTIHQMLMKDNKKKSEFVLVVDECSMLSLEMFWNLLVWFGGTKPQLKKMVLVGDPDQMMPVNGVPYFAELIKKLPCTNLTRVYRQQQETVLYKTIGEIKQRQPPSLQDDSFAMMKSDAYKMVGSVVSVAQQLAQKALKNQEKPMFVCFTHRFVSAINTGLQNTLNPVGAEVGKLGDYAVRVGDPVICCENFYDRETDLRLVANGQRGIVTRRKTVDFGDHVLGLWDVPMRLGYACTVDSSQGSQWPFVVVVTDEQRVDASWRLLYTALSRAQSQAILVCSPTGLQKALSRDVRDS